MIVTIARQVIKREKLPLYHELAKELTDLSRKEEGCIAYYSVQSKEDDKLHLFIEFWENQEAIDYHIGTEHFTKIVPQFTEMFEEKEIVSQYFTAGQ